MKLNHFLTADTKRNTGWIKDLNVRFETIKLLTENIRRNLFDINCSNSFLDTYTQVRKTKAKTNYWDFTKVKSFCTAKETINKTKKNLVNGRRYLQMIYLIRGLYKKYMKNLYNSIT